MEARLMTAKFPGKCVECFEPFPAGVKIFWKPGKAKHFECKAKVEPTPAKHFNMGCPLRGDEDFHDGEVCHIELGRAWKVLGKHYDLKRVENGEGWQYMGTMKGQHEFRHRCYYGKRVNIAVRAK